MATSMRRANRKSTGGRYHSDRKKLKRELTRFSAMTKVSDKKKAKTIRVRGGNKKSVLLSGNSINVIKDGKASMTKILNVVENAANPHLVRRNILTKGAIVETEMGKVKVTSRPGQDACLNGIAL